MLDRNPSSLNQTDCVWAEEMIIAILSDIMPFKNNCLRTRIQKV